MERIVMKSQVAKTFLLLSFLSLVILTPFVSTSLRSSYLYFLFNLLIMLLALEAGLLASISKPQHDDIKKVPLLLSPSTARESLLAAANHHHDNYVNEVDRTTQEEAAVTMAPVQEKKKKMAEERVQKLKRCRSKPSIFFIASCDEDLASEEEDDRRQQQQKVVQAAECLGDLMSKQELYMKAEMFIGNFYKQLKMQRQRSSVMEEHSWPLSSLN